MSEIKPALTAEEWEFYLQARKDYKRDYRAPMLQPDLPLDIAGTPQSIAAKALYGQSFGFTREDVKVLRSFAENEAVSHRYREHARWLADRIEALLPPAPAAT